MDISFKITYTSIKNKLHALIIEHTLNYSFSSLVIIYYNNQIDSLALVKQIDNKYSNEPKKNKLILACKVSL